MAEYPDTAPSVEPAQKNEKEKKPTGRIRKYWREIAAYDKAAQDWHEQSEKIVKMYLDQHRTQASARRFALLWSNIETLKPAVYAKAPTILCSRRHKDPDPVGRVAAEILERATNTALDLYKADERFRMVRDDRLLTARGQAWVRYEADTTGEKVNYEKVCLDYVHWKDFGHNVAGTWADVWLVWRRVYLSRPDVRKRFKDIADKLNYSAKTAADDDKEMGEHKACIYEVWDKKLNKTCFISKDYPDIIDDGEPPIDFRDFFPCPEPCYGSKTSKSLFPTPDYRYYQDQAQEIDDLTEKIANLTDFLIMRGFVPGGPSGDGADAVRTLIQTMQSGLTNNKTVFIPVESWAAFTEKGGAKGLVDWLPVDMVIAALQGAIESRNQLVQDVYQITGIADILRGQTDPDETLGAQQLKAQTGARRVRNTKDEVARFGRDIGQLEAEVIAEQFQPATLEAMSGYRYVPGKVIGVAPANDPSAPSGKIFDDQVLELLRNDKMRGFLIDIETDSTIQPDEDAEKQRRTEFVTAVGAFLKEAAPMMAQAPTLSPMLSEMLLFAVRGFRAGRQMEDTIETTLRNVAQELQQKAQQGDPKVQAEQMKAQAAAQKIQADMQAAQQKNEMELQKIQAKAQADMEMMQAEIQALYEKLGIEREQMQLEAQHDRQKLANQAAVDNQKLATQAQSNAMDLEAAHQQHALGQEAAQQKHDMGIEMLKHKAKQAKTNGRA